MVSRHTILVVDDEANVIKSLQDLLRYDYRVLGATDGQKALEILRTENVHAIISDQRMPSMTGVQLLSQAHSRCPDTMRILLTGYTDLQAIVDAINIGNVYRYVPKPWNPEELQAILREACERYDLNLARKKLLRGPGSLAGPLGKLGAGTEELAMFCRLTAELSRRRNLRAVLRKAASTLVSLLKAKACSIRLLTPDRTELALMSAANLSPQYVTKGRVLLADSPVDREALATGRPVYLPDEQNDPRNRYGPQTRQEGLVSVLCVPMLYRGQGEGVIHVHMGEPHEFGQFELAMLEAIATEAAAAAVNARLHRQNAHSATMKRSLEMAAQVQRRMIPASIPEIPGFQIGVMYVPNGQLAGDFYDFIQLPYGIVGMAVCDVVGKGVRASLLMASIRASLRAHVSNIYEMRDVIERVNCDLCNEVIPGDFATLFYGVINSQTRCLTYSNAGHCAPLLVRGGKASYLTTGGMALGIDPESRYSIEEHRLQPGDVVLAYTDGLLESANPEEQAFGPGRLEASAVAVAAKDLDAEGMTRQILQDVREFVGGSSLDDDTTILAIKAL